jgi:hypothetical protein
MLRQEPIVSSSTWRTTPAATLRPAAPFARRALGRERMRRPRQDRSDRFRVIPCARANLCGLLRFGIQAEAKALMELQMSASRMHPSLPSGTAERLAWPGDASPN